METLVATLQGVLKHFEVQPPLIVAGHSLGGMVALDWATTYPALVKSLILVSASDLPPVKGNKTFDLRPMIAKVIVDAEKIFVKQQKMDFALNAEISEGEILALGLMHTDKDSLKQFFDAAEDYDVRDKLSCLTVPCLIFRGREDLLIDEGMTREMQKRLATSRLITVPGGHNWFLQRPHLVIDALEENYGFLLNGEAKHLVS
jgi:pimeloyl-ACP methyl ester carboxylesterase